MSKALPKKFKIYVVDIRGIFISGSTFRKYLFRGKPLKEYNMTKNSVYLFPYSWGNLYQ